MAQKKPPRNRVAQGKGKTVPQAVKQISVTEQTFYRWRKEYGGMRVDQAKRAQRAGEGKPQAEATGGRSFPG